MMNNQFNTANLTTQHGIQMTQHVATSPPQASAAVLNTFLNAQQQQQQQQQQLAAAVAAGTLYGDPRQLHLNPNPLDKNYYATSAAAAATLGTIGAPQRFYTTAGATAQGTLSTANAANNHHPNTILITNNFAHQQSTAGQTLSPERNIRLVTSSSNPLNPTHTANLATTAGGYQHAQHVFNLNNNKQLQHLFPQHLLQQSSYQPAAAATTSDLLQQHFVNQHFPAVAQQQQQQTPPQMSQFYVSPENPLATNPLNTNPKIITSISSNNTATVAANSNNATLVANNSNPNQSTVVLDRINICINNLYTDTSSSSSASNSLASTPAQQPSPIIPAIQHKPIIDNGPANISMNNDMYESNVLVIDEPDSTTTATTPHTPPTTPENTPPSMPNLGNNNINSNSNNIISTTSTINSPSTSTNYQKTLDKTTKQTKQSFASAAQNIEKVAQDSNKCTTATSATTTTTDIAQTTRNNITTTTTNTPLTPPTPPSPETSNNNNKEYLNDNKQTPTNAPPPPPAPLFANGDDVFIKRHDDRFYLGTVIDTARNQFLVRFDDKTEVWCEPEQMRKFGNSSSNSNNSAEEKTVDQPMCVACKRLRTDSKVEICERCGRGYHRKCTTETTPGSEIWLCKRCAKPMKLEDASKFSSTEGEETEVENCLQLHYNLESLTWDAKHRMNEEQIYCYCGKTGKYDNNMLQCWRCLNWYHAHCTQKLKGTLLRGDCFFIFCCTICNDGEEYLRRLQASWLDMVHLVLYNLSILKKHHKYHHLFKDINPYVLEKRKLLPIPKEWISMAEKEFLDKIKTTLIDNTQIFMCGKDVKRDSNSFALRCVEPPEINKIPIKSQDILNDDFVFNHIKLQLLSGAAENKDYKYLNANYLSCDKTPTSKRKLNEDSSSHDVYEFDDTSEDEIPIKHILEKAKKTKLSPRTELKIEIEPKTPSTSTIKNLSLEKMDVEDDNANDALPENDNFSCATSSPKTKKELTPKKENKITTSPHKSPVVSSKSKEELPLGDKVRTEKSSRKRKAFTLSKSYTAAPHLIDTSSDENSSSSSRGTSLDLIIPPPKNFLGQNNPFRIISPKKNSPDINASTAGGKKSVSFGIFNTTALNFSTKLAALKSAGLFPKLSTSNLAKAAGQPRTVRTIKRRLSAKDITIGPNKEVRRRRTRRLSANVEVISTTTINPIPTNFFPIQAKDLLAAAAASTTTAASLFTNTQTKTLTSFNNNNNNNTTASSTTTASSNSNIDSVNNVDNTAAAATNTLPAHGRRLRQRPQKNSPNTSRRSSVSSNQSSSSSAAASQISTPNSQPTSCHQEDLKQTVNKYFGIVNRIESGEQFSIRAKRQLANGQMQYLIEWGSEVPNAAAVTLVTPSNSSSSSTSSSIQTTTESSNTTIMEPTTASELMEVTTTT